MKSIKSDDGYIEANITEIYEVQSNKELSQYYHDNYIIKNPENVLKLFKQYSNFSYQSKVSLLQEINIALENVSTNSRVLSQVYDTQNNQSMIECIIQRYFEQLEDQKISHLLLNTINLVLKQDSLHESIIKRITNKIIVEFYQNQVRTTGLLGAVRVFSAIYENKLTSTNQPRNVLVFNAQQNFTIVNKNAKPINWPFNKGYTFITWIYIQNVKASPQIGLAKLFTFYAQSSGGIQIYFLENKLYFRVLGSNYHQPHTNSNGVFLCTVQTKKWHFLAIEQQQTKTWTRPKLNIFLDKKIVNSISIDPPKPSSNAPTKIKFFQRLYCKTSNICLYLNPIGGKIEEFSKNMNSIDYAKDLRAFIFQQRNSQIFERSGIFLSNLKQIHKNRKMDCNSITPFFYLLRFLDRVPQQPLFNELLNIMILYLRSSNENQQQAEKNQFFIIIGNLLTEVNIDLLDANTIKVLLHIKHTITDQKLLDQYFSAFLWKLLHMHIHTVRKIEIMEIIRSCFTQNLAHFSMLLGLDEILNFMIKYEARKIQCCERHQRAFGNYLNINSFIENQEQVLLINTLQIIQQFFANPKIDLNVEFIKILRLVLLKFSPCFQLALLGSIKKILDNKMNQKLNQDQAKKTLKNLAQNKSYLIYMFKISNSPFIDVKAESLKAIFYLVNQKVTSNLSELQLTTYISQVLWNINQIKKESPEKINSLKKIEPASQILPVKNLKGFKQMRLDFTDMQTSSDVIAIAQTEQNEIQKQQTQMNQAPSMSNRRKPNLKFSFDSIQTKQKKQIKEQIMQQEKTIDPIPMMLKPKLSKKKNFNLNIDTEKINELYSYGGQKGKQIVMDQDDQNDQIEKIRLLAKKCVSFMNNNRKSFKQPPLKISEHTKEILSVKQNKKIVFPVQPLHSTRNQEAEKKNKGFKNLTQLKIIEESQKTDKSLSQKKQSKPRSQRSSQLSQKRTPKVSPVTKKEYNENMFFMYSAILECIFQRTIQKMTSPAPKIMSLNCLEMLFNWGKYCTIQTKQCILQDLNIVVQSEYNLNLISNNQVFLNFILDSIYNSLISESEETLKHSSLLLKTLFQHLFFKDNEFSKKIMYIFSWTKAKQAESDCKLILFTLRYCWLVIIEAIEEYSELKTGNDTIRQNNFNALIFLAEQLIFSHYNIGCPYIQVSQDKLTYINNISEIPNLLKSYFKSEWIDYPITDRILTLFNKFFLTKNYLNLRRSTTSDQKFIEASLQSKNNSELIKQSEYYFSSHHSRGIILEISTIYSSFIAYHIQKNISCEQQVEDLIALAKLILILSQMGPQKNIFNKKHQIIQTFMFVLKTLMTYLEDKAVYLYKFMLYLRNYINMKYMNPINEKDNNCHLNLITQQITNQYFSNKTNLLEFNKCDTQLEKIRQHLITIQNEVPRKFQEKSISITDASRIIEEIKQKYEKQIMDYISNIIEFEKQRYQSTGILLEMYSRNSRSKFKKLWKRLRSYNSAWAHPQFYFQNDTLFNKNNYNYEKLTESNLYKTRINKLESKSKARYLLNFRLKQPRIVLQLEEKNQSKFRGYIGLEKVLTHICKNITQNQQKKQSVKYLNLGKLILDTLYPLRIESSNAQNIVYLRKAEMVTTLTVRTGTFSITADKLIFMYLSFDQKLSHLSMVPHRLRTDSKLIKQWPLQFIKQVARRRYVNRRSALELFFINGSSVFLNFPQGNDCQEISKKIIKLRHTKCPNLSYFKSLDPKKIIENSGLIKKWTTFEISNFQYLMHLNSLSGRSYKDLTQYHVFPWIICSFSDKLDLNNINNYRNLKKNMGCLGTQERIKVFQDRFNNYDPQLQGSKFHYGTHYSSPGIIYHYLVRISPFTEGAIELQGGKFDFADRLFFSVEDSYRNCTTEFSDVRQLTPEFFTLPEMFLNTMKYDLGVMQNKKRVNNVELPTWSMQNPYLFITKLRRAMQNDYVNLNINHWIDLIYGYKQRGQQAIKNVNVFYYLTYEDSVDFEKISDKKMKRAIESQILNFGQTPSQLFIRPHFQKNQYNSMNFGNLITNSNLEAKVYRPSNKKIPQQYVVEVNPLYHQEQSIIKLKWIKDSKLICIRRNGNVINYKWYANSTNRIPFQCAIEKQRKIQRISKFKYDPTQFYDPSLKVDNFPIEVILAGTIILLGGLAEGKLSLVDSQNFTLIETYKNHHETICSIISDTKDNFVITGDISGEVILWRIQSNQGRLIQTHKFQDHYKRITSIFISYELRSFVTSSEDGSVNMYNIISGERIRAYFHPDKKPINNVVLTSSPLAAIIMLCNDQRMIYSYGINGQLIQRVYEKQCVYLLVPTLLKDIRTFQYLVYGNQKGQIYIRDLPFLDNPRKYIVAKDATVTNICISKDLRYLICSCSDGQLSVITDPNVPTKNY